MSFGPKLDEWVRGQDKVLLRKVDIRKGATAAALQAKKEFALRGIPMVCVFDGEGKLVDKFSGGNLPKLESLVKKALGN